MRSTRGNDYYLTITESRRLQKGDESVFEKSKLFVYKEDLDKVLEALQETVDYIKNQLMPEVDFNQFKNQEETPSEDFGSDLKWD